MKTYFMLLLALPAFILNAQTDFDLPKTREVIVTKGDSMIKANVLYAQQKEINTRDKSDYYWYHANSIKKNKGAYYGKLLYGEYIVFDANNNMVKRGEMNKGRKDGLWREWHANGRLKAESKWKNGVCHGRYYIYDSKGELIEKGRYKKGKKLDKKVEYFGTKESSKIKYVDLKAHKEKKIKKEKTESSTSLFRNIFKPDKEKKSKDPDEIVEEEDKKIRWWQFRKKASAKQVN